MKWKWGKGEASGEVIDTYTKKITRTINDSEITREGEVGNKALFIEQEDGSKVLKLESEVERAN